jgi:hypothetical protein
MMSYVTNAVLLTALLVTALCVGSMYRELRRLRGYQAQYLRVFDETKEAVSEIESAIAAINREGRDILKLLGGRIDEGRELAARLEALNALGSAGDTSEDPGTYAPAPGGGIRGQAARIFGSEIVKFGGERSPSLGVEPVRSFRLAPSVKTLKAS